MAYCEEHGIEVDMKRGKKSPYSMDANLLHISYEGGIFETRERERRRHVALVGHPENAPDEARYIEIGSEWRSCDAGRRGAKPGDHAGNPE